MFSGQTCICSDTTGQIATDITLAIVHVNPDCTVNLFLTKNLMSPSQLGNTNYKLIVLLFSIAEEG